VIGRPDAGAPCPSELIGNPGVSYAADREMGASTGFAGELAANLATPRGLLCSPTMDLAGAPARGYRSGSGYHAPSAQPPSRAHRHAGGVRFRYVLITAACGGERSRDRLGGNAKQRERAGLRHRRNES
jgi:hypothetical protein